MNVLELLRQDGIQPRKSAGTRGGEYASPCPGCGGKDRFRCWPEQGDMGKFWCRGCEKQGDAIEYLREFRGMNFQEACAFLDREPPARKLLDMGRPKAREPGWTPRVPVAPPAAWQEKALAFLEWSEKQLWSEAGKCGLEFLRGRRLIDEAIRTFRLGWNPKDFYRARASWGLPEESNDRGKVRRLWLPAGLVIPKVYDDRVERLRVRRPEGDPKYYVTPGSSTGPLIAGNSTEYSLVVESELDAVLLHQEAGDLVTVIALGSASSRPDQESAAILGRAKTILVALDSDEAGAREAWRWWKSRFPNAVRWPVIEGKDPTEAKANGLDLRSWVLAGIEDEAPCHWRELLESGLSDLDGAVPFEDGAFLFAFRKVHGTPAEELPAIWGKHAAHWGRILPDDAFVLVRAEYQARLDMGKKVCSN